ncbi:hypothetical protein SMKI_04G7210 [Saccharomyces mikatae IFO 1815]|uniref:Apa2p n=1 Tax=Saccharomyces mikatae IFO 1815 TaxID=226126 RepID=A0AA35IZI6_SACMI|nr:uncharacterized protein SMKI_04G7210 [Saccharomyces mikatae IFO 1815]CAI4038377.1 hypothetical protein SMKI_04G7210 [Saccharomyces mikatae IFO 1815]
MIGEDLKQKIHDKFVAAQRDGHLKLTRAESRKLKDPLKATQYWVTFAPSLALKSDGKRSNDSKKEDPFANPDQELVVVDDVNDDGEYKLLLNKFPVVPEHSLLVTSEFKDQKSALTPRDLMTAYKVLCCLDKDKDDDTSDEKYLVFYNCGPHSGSSQAHKHLQILRMPKEFTPFQDTLCNEKGYFLPTFNAEPLQDDKVSFAHFVLPLPESPDQVDKDLLAMCYISLMQKALTFFQDWANESPELIKSYNVLLTKKWICVVPRSHAKSEPPLTLNINSTGYCGMILVKDKEKLDTLTAKPHLVDKSLLECGFPTTAGGKPTKYHY